MHEKAVRAMATELLGEATGRDKYLSASGKFSRDFYNPLEKFTDKMKLKFVHGDEFGDTYERKTDAGTVSLLISTGLDRGIIKRKDSPTKIKRSLSREDNSLPVRFEIRTDLGGKPIYTAGPKFPLVQHSLDNPKELNIYHRFLRRGLAWVRQNIPGALARIGLKEDIGAIEESQEQWDSVYVEVAFLERVDNELTDSGFVRESERRWFHVESGISIEVMENYYPDLGEVAFDKVVFEGDFGIRELDYPMATGPFDVKNYLDHLNAMSDGILANAVALLRGIGEGVEVMLEEKIPPVKVFIRNMEQNDHLARYGASASEIAFSFKTTVKKATEYLEKLVKSGHMKKEKEGRTFVYKRAKKAGYKSDHAVVPPDTPADEKPRRGAAAARQRMKKVGLGSMSKKQGLDGNNPPERVGKSMTDLFGPVIASYSRKDALRDGELVDVTRQAKEVGFKYPTAFTRSLWQAVSRIAKSSHEDLAGRLHDIFMMMLFKIRSGGGGRAITFTVKFGGRNHHLRSEIGPGDTPAPVLTVGYPQDF